MKCKAQARWCVNCSARRRGVLARVLPRSICTMAWIEAQNVDA